MDLIGELYDAIEKHPPAIEARQLLIEQFLELGWIDAAVDASRELLKLDPYDEEAQACLLDHGDSIPARTFVSEALNRPPTPSPADNLSPDDLESAKSDLSKGYEALRARAKVLQREARLLRNLEQQKGISTRCDKHIPDLTAIVDGRISTLFRIHPPGSARAVARAMEAQPDQALDVAYTDLADMIRWLRSSTCQSSVMDNDAVREALAKRVTVLIAALSSELQPLASSALMHIEHEILQRRYVCDETMYGEPIADIQRSHFWVSEDGYAWDMEELAQALTTNGGVMRNPLSRQLFTPKDINAIVQHPLGNGLAAMQLEQSQMFQGVRPSTAEQLEKLAGALLADMSDDQIASREAVDGFLAYMATLPQAEQKALNELRVPAKDTHTGQAFDTSIGDAVRDAQGNRVCFHKVGDLMRQAALYLRKGR
ncbi:hypothetical protein MMC30_004854 [Trapelia coarctata]|nr:hypothetical protein [Trapelia coarctata]